MGNAPAGRGTGEGCLLASAGFGHGDVAGFEFVEDLVSRTCAPGGPVGEAAEDGGVEGVGRSGHQLRLAKAK